MAMKVSKLTIHRLSVDMSCGCRMYAEFEDTQCKNPIGSNPHPDEESPLIDKIFKACEKHAQDASLAMLEFIIGERLDEAIEDAQNNPATSQHAYTPPGIREGDTGGVVAVGGNIQSVMKVVKPVSVRERPQQPPSIKTRQRSLEELARVGAAPNHSQGQGSLADIQMEDVEEDLRYTPHIEEVLDHLDPQENGLLE